MCGLWIHKQKKKVKLQTAFSCKCLYPINPFGIDSKVIICYRGKIFFIFFFDTVSLRLCRLPWNSLCRPGWAQTHRDAPASASWCWDQRRGLEKNVWYLIFESSLHRASFNPKTQKAESALSLFLLFCLCFHNTFQDSWSHTENIFVNMHWVCKYSYSFHPQCSSPHCGHPTSVYFSLL